MGDFDDLGAVPATLPQPKGFADLGAVSAQDPNPDMTPVKSALKSSLDKHIADNTKEDGTKPAEHELTFKEAVEIGFGSSVAGLIKNQKMPQVLPEHAPMYARIAAGVGQLAGDFPAMVAGAEVGGLGGAAIGSVAPGAGTAVGGIIGGAYGSFALPAAIRKAMMDHYEKGDVKDFSDFWERTAATFIESSKAGLTGVATAGAGKYAGVVAPIMKPAAQLAAEVATMTTVGAAMEGHLPVPMEFVDGAILVGGLHGAAKVSKSLRNIYSKTGMRPAEVEQLAKTDPLVKQDLLVNGDPIPKAISDQNGIAVGGELGAKDVLTGGKVPSSKEGTAAPLLSDAAKEVQKAFGTPETEPGGIQKALTKTYEYVTEGGAYKDFVDKFDPIKKIDEEAYVKARTADDYLSKVKHVVEHGSLDFNDLSTTGKSLKEIIKPHLDDLDGLNRYMAAKRVAENLDARDIKSGISTDAAKQLIKEDAPKFEKAAQEMTEWRNNNLKYAKDAGLISQKQFDTFVSSGDSYAPFKRLFSLEEQADGLGSKGGKRAGSLKEMKGSDRKLNNIIDSDLQNTISLFKLAEKNRAAKTLIENVEKSKTGLLTPVENPKGNLAKNQFDLYRNGEREVWKAENPDVAESIKALEGNPATTNVFMQLAKNISSMKRLTLTITPDFQIKNFFRDALTSGSFSKGGGIPFVDAIRAMGDITGKSDAYYNWLKSGGAGGSFLELDSKYLENDIFKLNDQTKFMDKTWNVLKHPIDFLQAKGALLEHATRLAEFKRVSEGESSGPKVFAGGFAAREVTVDFNRIGAKMSAFNAITAFQNVSIQGLDRAARAIKENPAGTTMKAAALITAPSILLWYANKDEERHKQMPRWQKDVFWHIYTNDWQESKDQDEFANFPTYMQKTVDGKNYVNKGNTYRIPKPQELGILFGSLPERILDAYFTDHPNAMKDFEKTIGNLVTPALVPDAVSPGVEQWANKSMFTDHKIVPSYLEGVVPEFQYTEYTSETAKQIGKLIGYVPGVGDEPGKLHLSSPMVVENYVRAWSGPVGTMILQLADKTAAATGVMPDPNKPAGSLADIPFIKAFVVRYPSAGAQSIQDFYEEYGKEKENFNTLQLLKKSGDFKNYEKQMYSALDEGNMVKMDGVSAALSKMTSTIRAVYKSPDYTPDDKKQLIDGIYYQMMDMTNMANDSLRQLKKDLKEKGK